MWNQRIGNDGERIAATYLEGNGVNILERNYRTDAGEIDLIGLDHDTIIFFEVKTRTSTSYGVPELAITPRKLKRMMDCAEQYLQANPSTLDLRIDVIAILINMNTDTYSIEWIKNVTDGN
jgi:putative endonuclease